MAKRMTSWEKALEKLRREKVDEMRRNAGLKPWTWQPLEKSDG